MNAASGKASGSIRELASGRFQVRLRSRGGRRESLGTFSTRDEAEQHLTVHLAAMHQGSFLSPERTRRTLHDYAVEWLTERRDLKVTSVIAYERHLRLRILPDLGGIQFRDLDPMTIRRWYNRLPDNTTKAQAYAVLSIVCNAAVRDEYLARNPCKIKGGGITVSPERQIIGINEVYALADAIGEHFRIAVLLGAFGNVRKGEMRALTRADWDAATMTLRINKQLSYILCEWVVVSPKSSAGIRSLVLPDMVASELDAHLKARVGPAADARIVTGVQGGPLHDTPFRAAWLRANDKARAAGFDIPEGFRFHDLRHTGNTLVAKIPGITIADLQARLGDSTPKMALHYLHADEKARSLAADGLSKAIAEHMGVETEQERIVISMAERRRGAR